MKNLSIDSTNLEQVYHSGLKELTTLHGDEGDCFVFSEETLKSLVQDLADGLSMSAILKEDDFAGPDTSEDFLNSI